MNGLSRGWSWVLGMAFVTACAAAPDDPGVAVGALETSEVHRFTVAGTGFLGGSAAISGDGEVVVLGDPNYGGAGGVYAFRGPAFATEPFSRPGAPTQFGRSVAVSADGSIVWVGSPVEISAFVYRNTGGAWTTFSAVVPTGSMGLGDTPSGAGGAIATPSDGSFAVLGAHNSTGPGGEIGAAYIVQCDPTCGSNILALGPSAGSNFGSAVAVSADGSTAWVGARYEDFGGTNNAGGAFGFVRASGSWYQQGRFAGSGESAQFGWAIALSGTGSVLLVGAPGDATTRGFTGTASIFRRTGSTWSRESVLEGLIPSRRFGIAVALSGDGELAAVANDNTTVFLFVHRSTGWEPYGQVASSAPVIDFIPTLSLSSDGRRLLLGTVSAPDGGRADLFELSRPGDLCDAGDDCNSGFCVDGVCCVSACGGGESDCRACSVAAGGSSDGDCTNLAFGVPCRDSAGGCDVAEVCSGSSGSCPVDRFVAAGTDCAAGDCGAGRTCDGLMPICPGDPSMMGVVCRDAVGGCDVEETCDGVSNACPPDAFQSAGVTCLEWTGDVCDAPDVCTGGSAECLPRFLEGVVCRPPAGTCDVAEVCSGGAVTCPPDNHLASGVSCRASVSGCDPEEVCDGVAASCPSDVIACDAGPSDAGVGADVPPSVATGCGCQLRSGRPLPYGMALLLGLLWLSRMRPTASR